MTDVPSKTRASRQPDDRPFGYLSLIRTEDADAMVIRRSHRRLLPHRVLRRFQSPMQPRSRPNPS